MGKDNILQIKGETMKIEISHFHLIQTLRYDKPTPPNGARWCSLSYEFTLPRHAKAGIIHELIPHFPLAKRKPNLENRESTLWSQ